MHTLYSFLDTNSKAYNTGYAFGRIIGIALIVGVVVYFLGKAFRK